MTTQTRARQRTAKKAAKADEPKPFEQAEIDLAAAQENAQFQAAQLSYLQNRVGVLRIEVNRLTEENERLKSTSTKA